MSRGNYCSEISKLIIEFMDLQGKGNYLDEGVGWRGFVVVS